MAVLILTSASGAPGTSTTALGLALHWPRPVLLVDADRVPSHVVEVGFLAGSRRPGGGLLALNQAHRDGRDLSAAAWEKSVPLTDSPDADRRFLAGFPHPAAAELFVPMWPLVGGALAGLNTAGIDVIVDIGRIGSGIPTGLMEHCDALAICSRTSLRAMAGVRMQLAPTLDALDLAAPAAKSGIIVIGPNQPYSAGEIMAHFGVPVVATVPMLPEHAAVLSDGATPPRRYATSGLTRAYEAAAPSIVRALFSKADLGPTDLGPAHLGPAQQGPTELGPTHRSVAP